MPESFSLRELKDLTSRVCAGSKSKDWDLFNAIPGAKAELDPSDISRSKAEVSRDGCQAWRMINHLRVARGHKSVGLSNCLFGTEDEELSRDLAPLRASFGKEVRDEARVNHLFNG